MAENVKLPEGFKVVYTPEKDYTLGRIGVIDRGATFGLGRKLGGLIYAIGSYPVDRAAELAGVQNTPSFSERYHEIVDPTMNAINEYHNDKPVEAFSLELGSGFVNPANRVGVNYIKNAKNFGRAVMRSGVVGSGVGGVAGAMNTEYQEDILPNALAGSESGAAFGMAVPVGINGVGATYGATKRIFAPKASVAGKPSGLGNIVKDNESVRAVNRGIMASDDVAKQVLKEAPTEMGKLNEELAGILDKTTGRKLDIQNAIDTQQKRLGQFVKQNENKELFDFSPTVSDLKSMKPRSSFNPNRKITEKEAINKLRKRLSDVGLDVYNDELSEIGNPELGINHFVGEGKDPFVRTASQTVKNPDLKFTNDGKKYYIRKYKNNDSGNTFEDLFLTKDGKAFNKLPSDENHVAKKIRDAQDLSLASVSNAKTPTSGSLDNDNIPLQRVVVNKNLPRLSNYTDDLTPFQVDALNKAIAEGATKSTSPLGTLGATHRGQEVLNDMIEASFDKSIIGAKRPTTDTRQLMGLKERFNQILEKSGVKPFDESYAKAQALRTNFEKGYNFKPSETKFENLGLEKARDKRAFLQGRIAKILDNVQDEKSLAKTIRADENTLKKLMPPKKFSELIEETSRIDREYTRLNKLMKQADRAIDKPIAADRQMSERGESWSSYLGSLYDKANARMWKNSNTARALALLNGGAENPAVLEAIERMAEKYSLGSMAPYLAQITANIQQ